MDRLKPLLDKIRNLADEDTQDAIISRLLNMANRNNLRNIELKNHIDFPTLEEAIQQTEAVYCKANEDDIIYLLEDLIKILEMPDSEFSDDMVESDILDIAVENEELAEQLERLENVDDSKAIILLEMVVNKFSKDIVQEDIYTATRSKSDIASCIDTMLKSTLDAREEKEMLAYLDSAITALELAEKSKDLDAQTVRCKEKGGKGYALKVKRGEVYWAQVTRGVGHEESGRRPILILSNNTSNRLVSIVNAVLLSSRRTKNGELVKLKATEVEIFNSQLTYGSFSKRTAVNVATICTLDKARLEEHFATLDDTIMQEIEKRLCMQEAISVETCKAILKENGYTVTK